MNSEGKTHPGENRLARRIRLQLTAALWGLVVLLTILDLLAHFFGRASGSSVMATTRTIALAMYQYAIDHEGKYPSGNSSTEVFQKLVDGNYVSDPSLFFLDHTPGKRAARSNHLQPENICYDVTVPVDAGTPGDIPLVFCTGYRIEYKSGGRAIPLPDRPSLPVYSDGLGVTYCNNSAFYEKARPKGGVVTNIIPPDAHLGSAHYTQLTPEGSLESK